MNTVRLCLSIFALAAALAAPSSSTEIVVRPTELDVNGHVNNAKYVEYLQWGRWDWLAARGLDRQRLAELETVLVVARIEVNYRREALQGEKLCVSVEVEKLGEKSVTLSQLVTRGEETVADASVVLVAVDTKTRRSRLLPDGVRDALRAEP
jgi:YbgC/YbaW family acyl-CoA thioester hydrolase